MGTRMAHNYLFSYASRSAENSKYAKYVLSNGQSFASGIIKLFWGLK